MISTLKEVREALEILHNGLSWFKDSYPQDVNGSDDEAETEFQTAFTKLDALIAQMEKAEPVAWMYPSDLEKFQTNETFAHAFSVKVGCPDEVSVPLFDTPQSAPSTSPLTDKEIAAAWLSIKDPVGLGSQFIGKNGEAVRDFVRAIEAAHGIGAKP